MTSHIEVLSRNARTKLILNADNDESRHQLENCQARGKRVLNPIIDWTDEDIWEFLQHYGCLSNPLYYEGFKRIGCVGCPMAGKMRVIEFERWPVYRDNYIRAFQRMIDRHGYADASAHWHTGQDVFDWWMQEKNNRLEVEGQTDMWAAAA